MTSTSPTVVQRAGQPYAGIQQDVTMDQLAEAAHRIPEVLRWLEAQGIHPAGPPFFRYNLINMEALLSVEVGVPIDEALPGDEHVRGGLLPAGEYLTTVHVGAPDTLVGAVRDLLRWGHDAGLRWDMSETPSGERWGCRLESYLTDPQLEPDTAKWQTELAFRLAD